MRSEPHAQASDDLVTGEAKVDRLGAVDVGVVLVVRVTVLDLRKQVARQRLLKAELEAEAVAARRIGNVEAIG